VAHRNTVLSQLLTLMNRHEFESLAKEHHSGQKLRKMTRWGQFVALFVGQLSGRRSLRDIIANLGAQQHKLYHSGVAGVSRSSLARVNESQPYTLYESLFGLLLGRCRNHAPKHPFRFRNPLFSMDASTIELSLSIFPWAEFRKKKGAIKLHVGLDHNGLIPAFMSITEGKCHDIQAARNIELPRGSILVVDRGYNDYEWFNSLNKKGIFFVTRLKKNARYRVVKRKATHKKDGLTSDQEIILTSKKGSLYEGSLRRIGYICPETGRHYFFLTNNMKLAARTIAAIYKARWQIELFFKWIKQNLKIKSFVGTSKNAVLTQIWIAMCAYLLMAYLKFSSRITLAVSEMVRLLQLNLFDRRNLFDLLSPPDRPEPGECRQLAML
jgi:hypothetical protein